MSTSMRDEEYHNPDVSLLDPQFLALVQEVDHLRAAGRHWRSVAQAEAERADELQRRLNELLTGQGTTEGDKVPMTPRAEGAPAEGAV